MDWFKTLTGFRETDYKTTRDQLEVQGSQLISKVNGKRYGIGSLELVSLHELRERAATANSASGRMTVKVLEGDVRQLHRLPAYEGALFQVASQFNMLEMVGPHISPEHGVTCYQNDATQGPACAIAAGAATIYRNYFAPVGDAVGQTQERQLNGLAKLGDALSHSLGRTVDDMWKMRNGYALCSQSGLQSIAKHLDAATPNQVDALRGDLVIGIHSDVEVTDDEDTDAENQPQSSGLAGPLVSQAFCSALPVAYSEVPTADWCRFASLVLEAAYEATLWAGVLNMQRGKSRIVLLTMLGGGAFGNAEDWIYAAMRRALHKVSGFALDVRLVSYHAPSDELLELAEEFR